MHIRPRSLRLLKVSFFPFLPLTLQSKSSKQFILTLPTNMALIILGACLPCALESVHQVTPASASLVTEQPALYNDEKPENSISPPAPYRDDAVAQFLEVIRTAQEPGQELETRLKSIVSTNGWTENFAKSILNGIEKMIKSSVEMAEVMADAVKCARHTAWEFAKEHPYYAGSIVAGTVVALGVLILLSPWVLEALGFAARGPRAVS